MVGDGGGEEDEMEFRKREKFRKLCRRLRDMEDGVSTASKPLFDATFENAP
jgi:hypothetical protein